jgi:hypothetical protein
MKGSAIRWLFVAALVACTQRGEPTMLVREPATCATGGTPADAPVYEGVVRTILERGCADCHGDVQRYGAPSWLRLDRYEDEPATRWAPAVQGARTMAGCVCATAVQALPDAPIRMPFHPLRPELCASDRETLARWIDLGSPRSVVHAPPRPLCAGRDATCVSREVPEAPEFERHVWPVLQARCGSCHSSPRCFDAAPQAFWRATQETAETVGCPGGAPPVLNTCIDGLPVRVVERGVGAFEYRGEIVRSAVERLPSGVNAIGPMPYQPPYRAQATDLVPPLCDADREVLRRWARRGRRSGSDADLEPECVSEGVPAAPTWRMDVYRILASRCGLCHGERNRAGIEPPFRIDLYRRGGADEPAGLRDDVERCREIPSGESSVSLFPPAESSVPIEDGRVRAAGRAFSVEAGPCTPGGTGTRHVRIRLPLVEYVRALALEAHAMPAGADRGARAPLCDADRTVLFRWIERGMAYE